MHSHSQYDAICPRSGLANFGRLLGFWLGIFVVSCPSVCRAESPYINLVATTPSWVDKPKPVVPLFDPLDGIVSSAACQDKSPVAPKAKANSRAFADLQYNRLKPAIVGGDSLQSEIIRAQSPSPIVSEVPITGFDGPLFGYATNACQLPCGPPCSQCCPPVYPSECFADSDRLSFCRDVRELPQRLKSDVSSLMTCENVLFLGAAAGITVALRNNVDDRVIHDTQIHGPRWGQFSHVMSHGGDALAVHAPILTTMYLTSLCEQDEDLHELTLTMFTGYKFAILSSLGLQYVTGTHDSNGGIFNLMGDNGFPSEPMAGSFALAAILDERFGWRAGLPAYLISGLIGFSEIDQQRHTVSDVFFGAALGYVIGKSVGAQRYRPNTPYKLVPFSDAVSGTQGMGFQVVF